MEKNTSLDKRRRTFQTSRIHHRPVDSFTKMSSRYDLCLFCEKVFLITYKSGSKVELEFDWDDAVYGARFHEAPALALILWHHLNLVSKLQKCAFSSSTRL